MAAASPVTVASDRSKSVLADSPNPTPSPTEEVVRSCLRSPGASEKTCSVRWAKEIETVRKIPRYSHKSLDVMIYQLEENHPPGKVASIVSHFLFSEEHMDTTAACLYSYANSHFSEDQEKDMPGLIRSLLYQSIQKNKPEAVISFVECGLVSKKELRDLIRDVAGTIAEFEECFDIHAIPFPVNFNGVEIIFVSKESANAWIRTLSGYATS